MLPFNFGLFNRLFIIFTLGGGEGGRLDLGKICAPLLLPAAFDEDDGGGERRLRKSPGGGERRLEVLRRMGGSGGERGRAILPPRGMSLGERERIEPGVRRLDMPPPPPPPPMDERERRRGGERGSDLRDMREFERGERERA